MLHRFRPAVVGVVRFFKDQWFDRSRNVHTSGEVWPDDFGVPVEELDDSEPYQPARPGHTRQTLREMPVKDLSNFSYVDLGSGKGRTLFIAAEFPFKQIIGVEFSRRLHDQACANIRSFRSWKRGCRNIHSLHQNAKDFTFPEDNIVLYLFNPFGLETTQKILDKLEASLRLLPRHVIIILMRPRPGGGDLVAGIRGIRLAHKTWRYQIFDLPASASR